MKMKYRNSTAEVAEIDVAPMQPGIIGGGHAKSLLERLSAAERQALDAWAREQPVGENGAVDLRRWPGWLETFARAQRESKSKSKSNQ
ncbi:hypothetical protein [Burkholderia pyrrocinia]|uniref:hypothetical protein n=1 Tax=Burkholderia pyrrocinia TaxID=60550 RepID=UPI001046E19F|nr:hypothetical protein [Burkholderia pyrrocinia]TDA48098.1 hypothetical protein EVG18_07365 [Burkholderia pyrrocinia]